MSAVAVLSIGAVSFASIHGRSVPTFARALSSNPFDIEIHANQDFNFERYGELKPGMSLDRVIGILGRSGTQNGDQETMVVAYYWWHDADQILVSFANGRLSIAIVMRGETQLADIHEELP